MLPVSGIEITSADDMSIEREEEKVDVAEDREVPAPGMSAMKLRLSGGLTRPNGMRAGLRRDAWKLTSLPK